MTVDGISATPDFLDKASKAVYEVLPVSKKKDFSSDKYDTGAILSRSVSGAAITTNGKKINQMDEKLDKIDDREKRREAEEGLKKTTAHLAQKGDGKKLSAFLDTMDEFSASGSDAFHKTFETAHRLSEQGYDMERWVDTFIEVEEHDLQSEFVAETRKIMESEGGQSSPVPEGPAEPAAAASVKTENTGHLKTLSQTREKGTLDKFLDTIGAFNHSGLEKDERLRLQDRLTQDLSIATTLEEKEKVMDRYMEENISRTGGP